MAMSNPGKSNSHSSSALFIGAALSFGAAVLLHNTFKKPDLKVSKQESALNVNTIFLRLLSMGNKRLIADTLWIQTLIESDIETYRGDPHNNWMYLRFKSIAALDPKFYENYLYGGQYLYIIKDDVVGGAEIMELGLKQYPNDFQLNFNAGFNYYFEMGDVARGLPFLQRIKDHPERPAYLPSLLIKLQHTLKPDPVVTIRLLKEAYDETKDPRLKHKLESDIYSLKATMDLACLNAKKANCERLDAYGVPYVFENGVYSAARKFQPYRLQTVDETGQK